MRPSAAVRAVAEAANPSLTEEHTNLLYRAALRVPGLPLGFGAGAQGTWRATT